jgi:uncharacterized membrane protein YeaQ/YmgE (transglycosylase-associated protein family)
VIKQMVKKVKVLEDKVSIFFNDMVFNLQSNLGTKICLINKEVYKNMEEYSVDNNIKAIYYFYINELESFCEENKLDKICELISRKKELENDKNYFLNIMIGVITGIVSSKLVAIIQFQTKLDPSSILGATISSLIFMGIILASISAMFFMKYTIKSQRSDAYNRNEYLNDFELKIIKKILDELQEKTLVK